VNLLLRVLRENPNLKSVSPGNFKKEKDMRLRDKVAIITGGGINVGKAIAITFASEAATVVVASRNIANLEKTVEEIKEKGGSAKAIQTDITDEKQVQNMVKEAIKAYGQIDILVNNAGIAGLHANVVDMKLDEWNEVLNVDLTGSMLCAREVLKYMIPQRSGNIINIAAEGGRSGDGRSGYPMRSPYCCAKMGLIGLTETLSIEVGKYNIRVNAISPAGIAGERSKQILEKKAKAMGLSPEEMDQRIAEYYSLGRHTQPSEIASCAVFLASDESSAITGQTVATHCGQHIFFG
jgi:3-oxoacyl-[acyl-carrier protein] reductase